MIIKRRGGKGGERQDFVRAAALRIRMIYSLHLSLAVTYPQASEARISDEPMTLARKAHAAKMRRLRVVALKFAYCTTGAKKLRSAPI